MRSQMTVVDHRMSLLRDDLLAGRREFASRFCAYRCSLKPGETLTAAVHCPPVYRLRSGWACQIRTLSDCRIPIIDVYLPGDIIGVYAAFHVRPSQQHIIALTSIEIIDTINEESDLYGLLAHRQSALYIAWLLAKRQQRVDCMLTAISSLDARGRLAVMIFDFYKRLHSQKLISSAMYNLPLTQSQIGNYLGLTVVHVNRV